MNTDAMHPAMIEERRTRRSLRLLVTPASRPETFEVRNPDTQSTRLVDLNATTNVARCSCEDSKHNDRLLCKHSIAALRFHLQQQKIPFFVKAQT